MKLLHRLLPLPTEQVDQIHRALYILGLMTIACGLAWSNALMSIGQFILAGNWLLEGDFKQKWKRLKQEKDGGLLLSFFALVLIGFLWTENFDYAIKDARIKLPLLLLPFFIGSSKKLKPKELRIILGTYLITLLLLFMASLAKYFGILGDAAIQDKRELSIFISHIRYGLNLLLGSLIAFYYSKSLFVNAEPALGLRPRPIIAIAISLILFTSLLILQLYTAFLIGLLIIGIYLIKLIFFSELKNYLKSSIFVLLLGLSATLGYGVYQVYSDFHSAPKMSYDQELLMEYSPAGNLYQHKPEDQRKENGVYLYRYLQEKELQRAWEKRSQLVYEGIDQDGNPLKKTLIRYLSSRGLTKDSMGMAALDKEEIEAIESGIPNQYYLHHWPVQNRLYTTLYELQVYRELGYAEGFSLGMRLEFWKTASRIIKQNPCLGVGTGDVQDAFDLQYHLDDSSLSEKNRRRAHNQYLTIWLTFGIFGLLYFLYYLLKPLKGRWNSFYPIFLLIVLLSFLTEDTLETQAGVTFFAFFNSLFVLGIAQESKSE